MDGARSYVQALPSMPSISNPANSPVGWDPDDQTSFNRRFFKTIFDHKPMVVDANYNYDFS